MQLIFWILAKGHWRIIILNLTLKISYVSIGLLSIGRKIIAAKVDGKWKKAKLKNI